MANYFEYQNGEWVYGVFPPPDADPDIAWDMRQPRWSQVVEIIDEIDAEDVAIMFYGLVYVACDRFGSAGTGIRTIDDVMNSAGKPLARTIGLHAWLARTDLRVASNTKHYVQTLMNLPTTPCHITGCVIKKIR